MFEKSVDQNANNKKKKAILYAGGMTLLIAIIYIILLKQDVYTFKGFEEDIVPANDFFQEAKQKIGTSINKGNEIIDNKKNN